MMTYKNVLFLVSINAAASMIPAMIRIRNNMDENINVNLTFQDSTGPCEIPEYPIAPKKNSSQPVPLTCFPLIRINVIISGGGCSYTPPTTPEIVPPSLEVNSKMGGSSCEIVPVQDTECCKKKSVGGKLYNLVRIATDEESKSYECSLPCIYEREGRQFCFRPGNLISECATGGSYLPAILITGGLRGNKDASIYIPNTNQSCILPDLPTRRYYHSQVGLRACGGTIGITNCDTWDPETGSWNAEDVQLIGCRAGNSWTTANGKGTYLIGSYGYSYGNGAYDAWDNAKTSDLLKPDGTVVPGFNTTIYIDGACSIADPDTDTAIITGGAYRTSKTDVYGKAGWIKDLSDLVQERYMHACTSYVSNEKRFYLVTGGTTGSPNVLDSTEIYSGVEWSIVESAVLPYATVWSQITNIDEKILLLGGSDYEQTYYDFILEFSPDTEAWTQVGVMTRATAAHGVANVNFEDFKDVCSFTHVP